MEEIFELKNNGKIIEWMNGQAIKKNPLMNKLMEIWIIVKTKNGGIESMNK